MADELSPSPQGAQRLASERSRARRVRLACRRCQHRKIKCDERVPKCSACQRAGVECENGKRVGDEGSISRLQETPLRQYIERLENALRQRAPGLRLENLQSLDGRQSTVDPFEPSGNEDQLSPGDASFSHELNESTVSGHAQQRSSLRRTPNETLQGEDDNPVNGSSAHEIGLVPLSNGISKYVGPSSGLVFARSILDRAGRKNRGAGFLRTGQSISIESPSTTISRSLLPITPGDLPPTLSHATQLSRIYFEHVHIQHPFLHGPTFSRVLEDVYQNNEDTSRWKLFQVRMVLAISAVILARRLSIPYSGERLYALAIQDKDSVDFHSSITGLQCLLLVYMYTLHSPSSGVSSWHLNYEFLAIVLDLGLQRDVPANVGISKMERELRTRIFWVVYSIDRTLATTLGRPIGLRDEGCDLRLPSITDDVYIGTHSQDEPSADGGDMIQEGSMACAITLFTLANLNSELKYILHSVNQLTPRYTYPQITDIKEWQQDLWTRLQECFAASPKFDDERRYISVICEIKYLELSMHLFRPTPRIRSPTVPNLRLCFEHAERTIVLWTALYKMDRLSYSWVMIHSVCLSALTILYCVWTCPEITCSVRIDAFMSTMRESSVLLSIAGEYWTEARRSRHQLDELVNATTRWLIYRLTSTSASGVGTSQGAHPLLAADQRQLNGQGSTSGTVTDAQQISSDFTNAASAGGLCDGYIDNDNLLTFLGAPDPFMGNLDLPFEGLFTDYQPVFDLNGSEVYPASFL